MWIHNLNPTILSLGPLEIRWYGLAYVLGFFLSVWWLHYLSKKGKLNLESDQIWDLLFYLMIGVLVGSRLFEIFWEPQLYLSNFFQIFKVWQGGMSFHGGLVGIVTAALIYCKKHKINFWTIADVMAFPTLFALALGRIANFINGELVGRPFGGKGCVVFPNYDDVCRHPTMLYAAAKRFAIAGGLYFLTLYKNFKPGFIFWNFVFWEGVGRFVVDFYRVDKLFLKLSLGQWFSSVMIIVAIYFFYRNHKEDCKKLFGK
jgi:phosphatidylglycerol---prolipoprotein diacylglyceryl transferase